MGRYLSRVSKEVLQSLPYADSSKYIILIALLLLFIKIKGINLMPFIFVNMKINVHTNIGSIHESLLRLTSKMPHDRQYAHQ